MASISQIFIRHCLRDQTIKLSLPENPMEMETLSFFKLVAQLGGIVSWIGECTRQEALCSREDCDDWETCSHHVNSQIDEETVMEEVERIFERKK